MLSKVSKVHSQRRSLGGDVLHNRENAMMFLDDMQVAIKTYQASESAFKNTGPIGFSALGGRMGVPFTHLSLQSENPPEVVAIEQIMSVLQGVSRRWPRRAGGLVQPS